MQGIFIVVSYTLIQILFGIYLYNIRKDYENINWITDLLIIMEENKMNKDKSYFECILIDDTNLQFDKLCSKIDEYGKNKDMIVFKAKNLEMELVLQIIPKNQIKRIVNNYTTEDLDNLFKK